MSATSGMKFPPNGNSDPANGDAAAFGEFLRARRQRAGISLDRISSHTKIPQRHFDSLERGDVRSWPRGMYTRAFLRAYAESVGIDMAYAVEQFERAFQKPAEPVSAPAQPSLPLRRPWTLAPRVPLVPTFIAAVVVALVVAAASWAFQQQRVEAKRSDLAVARPTTPIAVRPTRVALPPASPPEDARADVTHAVAAVQPARVTAAAPPVRAAAPARSSATDGELLVTSDPPGARVTVNGIGWGVTPVTIRYLPFGAKRVRVTKAGYVSAEHGVSLTQAKPSAQVDIALQERP